MNFEHMEMMRAAARADDARNRSIADDGWSPDTSAIDGPTWADNRAATAATEDWWADIARLREKFPHE